MIDQKPYRFLIVEDNGGDYIIIEELIADMVLDPQLVHARNYKEAAEILGQDRAFSAILLDLSLPDKSGRDLITQVLAASGDCCPIVVLTGYTDIEFSIRSISQGVMDYLLKDDLTATTLYKSIIYSIERKKSISELNESHKQYSDLFNLSPQPMWLFDTDTFRFVQVNKAAVLVYGYSEEEFLNMSLIDVKIDEEIPGMRHSLINDKGLYKNVVRHRIKNGDIIYVEIYSTPMVISNRNFRCVISIDITEKMRYEQELTKAIIKTQEDERYEIGGELHDNVCQILASCLMTLGMLKDHIPPEKTMLFDQSKNYISMSLNEIRNISHRLAPAFLDDDSTLEETFRRLLDAFNIEKKYRIKLSFGKSIQSTPIIREISLNLYRILQEQLKNILKYAKASIIEVDVDIKKMYLVMKTIDNGIGFNTEKLKLGIGLANMKRRAELFSGKFDMKSSPGNGCTIMISLPLEGKLIA